MKKSKKKPLDFHLCKQLCKGGCRNCCLDESLVRFEEAQKLQDDLEKMKVIYDIVRGKKLKYWKQLRELQAILNEYGPRFTMKCKAGPPSDYQDLWFLTKEFRTKLEELLKNG